MTFHGLPSDRDDAAVWACAESGQSLWFTGEGSGFRVMLEFVTHDMLRSVAAACLILFSGPADADPLWSGSGIDNVVGPAHAHSRASYREPAGLVSPPRAQLDIDFFPSRHCMAQVRLRFTGPSIRTARSMRIRVDRERVWQYPIETLAQAQTVGLDWVIPPGLLRALRQGKVLRIQIIFADAPSEYRDIPLSGAEPAIAKALTACRRTNRAAQPE